MRIHTCMCIQVTTNKSDDSEARQVPAAGVRIRDSDLDFYHIAVAGNSCYSALNGGAINRLHQVLVLEYWKCLQYGRSTVRLSLTEFHSS